MPCSGTVPPRAEAGREGTIDGLAGNGVGHRGDRPSEAIFLGSVEALPGGETGEGLLEKPLQNPNWLPSVQVVAIRPA